MIIDFSIDSIDLTLKYISYMYFLILFHYIIYINLGE